MSMICVGTWLLIFCVYQVADLSEIWLALFTGFISLLLLLTSVQDTIEVGPLDVTQTAQLDANRDRYHHGALTKVNPFFLLSTFLISFLGGSRPIVSREANL
jgi:hypothetical protein